jgi:hypothetical protein
MKYLKIPLRETKREMFETQNKICETLGEKTNIFPINFIVGEIRYKLIFLLEHLEKMGYSKNKDLSEIHRALASVMWDLDDITKSTDSFKKLSSSIQELKKDKTFKKHKRISSKNWY